MASLIRYTLSGLVFALLSLAMPLIGAESNPQRSGALKSQAEVLPKVKQTLVAPPFLPQHDQVAGDDPKVVTVEMVVEETEIEIDTGVFVRAKSFNGTIPGPG